MFTKVLFGQNWGKVCGYGDKGHLFVSFLHETSVLSKKALFVEVFSKDWVKDIAILCYLRNVVTCFP